MMKRKISFWTVICMLLALVPIQGVAATDIRLITEGFPTEWVAENRQVRIAADNSLNQVVSMTVNGETVTATEGSPYYLLKQLSYDANSRVLTMGVFAGNLTAVAGQFAFSYDTQKMQPYTEGTGQGSCFTAYTAADGAAYGYGTGAPTHAPKLIRNLPTETRTGGSYVDTQTGNGYINWYVAEKAGITADKNGLPILKIRFQLSEGVALADLGEDAFGLPSVSDLYKPSMDASPSMTVFGETTKQTANDTLVQAVYLNGSMYNGGKLYPAFVFTGTTNGNTPFSVQITDTDGVVHIKSLPVQVDLTAAVAKPTFALSIQNGAVAVSDFAGETVPSGMNFKAEFFVNNNKTAEGTPQNGVVLYTAEEGTTVTVRVTATTGTGVSNFAEQSIFVPYGDKTPPTIQVSGLPESGWANDTVTLTISASDASGIAEITANGTQIPIDGGTFSVSESGSVYITATDTEGNTAQKTVLVQIDKTAPTATVSVSEAWGKTNSITVTAQDEASGVDTVEVNGDTVSGENGVYTYTATANGAYPIVITDKAGNAFQTQAVVSKVDKTAPTATVSVSEAWGKTNSITVTAQDEASGVDTVEVNGDTVSGENGVYTYTATANGAYPIVITDKAGNTLETAATVSKVDNEKPAVEIHVPLTWCKTGAVTITATDAQSGVDKIFIEDEERSTLTVTANGSYRVRVTDKAGNVFEGTAVVDKIDTEKPVVSVSDMPTEPCQSFVMEITATDAASGVRSVTVNDTPLTQENGVYAYTVNQNKSYTICVTDYAGNAETVVKTVTVIDNEQPVLSFSGNPTEWTKNSVQIRVTADKPVIFAFENQTTERTTETTFTIAENGTYTVTATDVAGNSTAESITVSYIDKTNPDVRIVAQESWGKTNTITIYATDAQSGVDTVEVNGNTVNGTNGVYTYTVAANGTYAVTVTDKVGNAFAGSATVSKVDRTNPTLTVTEAPVNPCRSFTFTAEAQDAESGIATLTVNGNEISNRSYTVTANGTYVFKAKDLAGNETVVTRKVTVIDRVAPVITDILGIPTAWTKENATITVVLDKVCQSAQADGVPLQPENNRVSFTATASKAYAFCATDLAGNTVEQSITVSYIDKTNPDVCIAAQESWGKTNTITIYATDAQSGVDTVEVNGNTVNGTNGVYTYTVAANGTYAVTVTDKVGNAFAGSATVSKVDRTNPTASVTVQNTWGKTNLITVTAQDEASGIASVLINGDTVNGANGVYTYAAAVNGNLPIAVTDGAGNVLETAATVSKVDRTAPTITVSAVPNDFCKEHSFTIAAQDEASGVETVTVNGNPILPNGAGEYICTVTENGTYSFKATDFAGNEAITVRVVDKIDRTEPVFNGDITVARATETTLVLNLPMATDDNGSVSYAVYFNGSIVPYAAQITVSDLTMGTSYPVKLIATDTAGNQAVLQKQVSTAGLGSVLLRVNLSVLKGSGAPAFTATVNGVSKPIAADGTAVFADLTAGEYTVKLTGEGYLDYSRTVQVTQNQETVVSVAVGTEFLAGDVVKDGKLDLYDFNAIASNFAESRTDAQLRFDLNRDGKIDAEDTALFRTCFMRANP